MEAYRAQVRGELSAAIIGGHSFGGRVASLVAAQEAPRGLVLLSYPLHRPGHQERPNHTGQASRALCCCSRARPIRLPGLTSCAMPCRYCRAELVTYERVGHGLTKVLDDALDRGRAIRRADQRRGRLIPAAWLPPFLSVPRTRKAPCRSRYLWP